MDALFSKYVAKCYTSHTWSVVQTVTCHMAKLYLPQNNVQNSRTQKFRQNWQTASFIIFKNKCLVMDES